ncbi:MAG: adenylate kinase family protein [Candidatus Thorarchaeota archaeon]
MSPVIAISGTPGTGKTVVAKLLSQELGISFIEMTHLIETQHLHSGRDPERGSLIADIGKLQQHLVEQYHNAAERIIIVGHFADEVPETILEILVVLRCHPLTLIDRLRTRNWPEEKIVENIQAEILGECTAQGFARHTHNKIFEVDTTVATAEEVAKSIKAIITGKGQQYVAGKISWLQVIDPQILHHIMEKNSLP